jgi:uncharacterized protein (TIGR02001 family)
MARGRLLAATIKSGILGVALVAGVATQAFAGDPPKLELSGSATFTTDYIFRGVSNTSQDPAVQPEFDVTYGMFYAGIWGSNTAFGNGIEIDYYGGIAPKFWGIDWNVGGLEYTYPSANAGDYFELLTSAAKTWGNWNVSVKNYWSPDWAGIGTQSDAIEVATGYSFTNKLFGFFTPSVSGGIGWQTYEKTDLVPNYTYWNAGLTLGFLDHWSADIRYYDTNYSKTDCAINSGGRDNCDARVVGAIKATF